MASSFLLPLRGPAEAVGAEVLSLGAEVLSVGAEVSFCQSRFSMRRPRPVMQKFEKNFHFRLTTARLQYLLPM